MKKTVYLFLIVIMLFGATYVAPAKASPDPNTIETRGWRLMASIDPQQYYADVSMMENPGRYQMVMKAESEADSYKVVSQVEVVWPTGDSEPYLDKSYIRFRDPMQPSQTIEGWMNREYLTDFRLQLCDDRGALEVPLDAIMAVVEIHIEHLTCEAPPEDIQLYAQTYQEGSIFYLHSSDQERGFAEFRILLNGEYHDLTEYWFGRWPEGSPEFFRSTGINPIPTQLPDYIVIEAFSPYEFGWGSEEPIADPNFGNGIHREWKKFLVKVKNLPGIEPSSTNCFTQDQYSQIQRLEGVTPLMESALRFTAQCDTYPVSERVTLTQLP